MAETGDDETSHGPPPRPSPPKRKRESLVIEARASEAGPLGAPASAQPWGRETLAGLLGGVVGAALALAGVWLIVAKPDLAPLDRRAAALQSGAEAADARMTALEAQAKTAAADRQALALRLTAAADAEAKLAGRIAALETSAGSSELQSSVEALKRDVAQRSKAAADTETALETRLATLEGASLRADALAPVAAEARAAKDTADKALAAAGAPPSDGRLAADEAEISALRARLDKLAAPKAETRVNPGASTASAGPAPAALAVAAMALRSRFEAGAPLGPALTALDRLGVSAQALAPLRPYAETGAPTLAALARSLAEVKPTPQVGPASGVAQRLLGEVQGLVKMHKVGDSRPGGDLSRVEAALAAGDLSGALAAFDALPPAARAAGQSWRESAEARLAAGRAAEALLSRAVADLGAGR